MNKYLRSFFLLAQLLGPVPHVMADPPAVTSPGFDPNMPMPAFPSPATQPDPNENPEAFVEAACAPMGGRWQDKGSQEANEMLVAMRDSIEKRQQQCSFMQAEYREACLNSAQVEQSASTYFRMIMMWQCHVSVLSTADHHEIDMVEQARQQACAIRRAMESVRDDANAAGAQMQFAPHEMMEQRAGIEMLCPECPLQEFEDLEALVTQRSEESRAQFEALPRGSTQSCAETGWLKKIPDFLMSPAYAQDELLTSEEGPFPGMKFGQHRTNDPLFDESFEIRKIQDEMSNHGGRDNLLNQHDWNTFREDVGRAIKAMKIKDSAEATLMFNLVTEKLVDVRSQINDRFYELKELKAAVDKELSGEDYVQFLKSLDAIVKKNRSMDDPTSANAHDPTFALWGLTIRNLMSMAATEGAKRLSLAHATVIITVISVGGNCVEYINWTDQLRDIKHHEKQYLELLDFSSSLEILLTQYEARVEAQEELIDKLRLEWDKESRRRKACKSD